jgi:hypothetical protein
MSNSSWQPLAAEAKPPLRRTLQQLLADLEAGEGWARVGFDVEVHRCAWPSSWAAAAHGEMTPAAPAWKAQQDLHNFEQ